MLFNFIWKNKILYVRKSVITNQNHCGGLNFLDFTTLNNTFKINWIRQFINNPTSLWNFIPNYVFSKIGGLGFLLRCNFSVCKLPLKLSNFHKQMLLAWSLVYKHNFSPHRCLIWNSMDILYKRKTLFFDNWFRNNILFVSQLFDSNGSLYEYSEFLRTYNTDLNINLSFCFKDVFFGIFDYNQEYESKYFIVNLLFLLAKFHIHKCKFSGGKPYFPAFLIDVNNYIETLRYSNNLKAQRTVILYGNLNIT